MRTVRKVLPILVFLILLVGLGALLISLVDRPKHPVNTNQVIDILTQHGLQPYDVTEDKQAKNPDWGLNACIVAESKDLHVEFYEFHNSDGALEVYSQGRSNIVRSWMSFPRVEIKTQLSNYNIYRLKTEEMYAVSIRVGNTALYAYCDVNNLEIVNSILAEIKYIEQ